MDVPLGQQSGQILFSKKTLRIRTNTLTPKTPITTGDYDCIEKANIRRLSQILAREINRERSMKGAQ